MRTRGSWIHLIRAFKSLLPRMDFITKQRRGTARTVSSSAGWEWYCPPWLPLRVAVEIGWDVSWRRKLWRIKVSWPDKGRNFFFFFYFLFKRFILYWIIANWQCCHSFRWTAKWPSHTYTFIHFPPNSPPIQAAPQHWAEFTGQVEFHCQIVIFQGSPIESISIF